MKIELRHIKVEDLFNGYVDNSLSEEGVVGWSGNLDIRPKYQREFVYSDDQRKEVINTVMRGFPLSTMYWVKTSDNNYEVLDGQQRIISICQYMAGDFTIFDNQGNPKAFYNLTEEEKKRIKSYQLTVYFCEGSHNEKLDWFRIINIAGQKLTDQELLNAVYTGTWLTDAKKKFSKTNCVAYSLANRYVRGIPIRQDYLETVLKWISNNNIASYMSKHQHDEDADALWQYFQKVIAWVKMIFPNYRKDMKGMNWGQLYNEHANENYNSSKLEKRYLELLEDEEVQIRSTKGIYLYLIKGNEKYLSLRTFDSKQKFLAFENQKGVCSSCEETFTLDQMEADHIVPWSKGGKTIQSNCQVLCKVCNNTKSNN